MKVKNIITIITVFLFPITFVAAHEEAAPPPRTCTGSAEFSYVATGGNTDTRAIGLGGFIECKPGVWTYLAKGAFVSNESNDEETARSLDTLFRVSRDLSERLKGYGQFGYFQNKFAGIDNRYAVEGGISYLLVNEERHSLRVDGGIGYTKEDRVETPGIVDEDLSFATARTAGVYIWKISDNAEIGEDAGFTFNLSDGSDWRFGNTVYIAAKINAIFSLKLSNVVTYLNEPVPGFGKTDYTTSAAIVAKF